MADVYYLGDLDSADRSRMSSLIKAALYKADHGSLPPSLGAIKNVRIKSLEEVKDIYDTGAKADEDSENK